jgi:hypothetical protein
MNSDYFRKLSEMQIQPKRPDPTILAAKVAKYLASGKKITVVPAGSSGIILAPMGIKRSKGAQK